MTEAHSPGQECGLVIRDRSTCSVLAGSQLGSNKQNLLRDMKSEAERLGFTSFCPSFIMPSGGESNQTTTGEVISDLRSLASPTVLVKGLQH